MRFRTKQAQLTLQRHVCMGSERLRLLGWIGHLGEPLDLCLLMPNRMISAYSCQTDYRWLLSNASAKAAKFPMERGCLPTR